MINDPYSSPQSGACGCCYWFTTSSLNAVAALIHAIQAVVVLGLSSWLNTQKISGIGKGIFSLQKTVSVWHKKLPGQNITSTQAVMSSDDFYIEYMNIDAGELDVRYIIVAFFTLSAIFQATGGYFLGGLWGRQLRYIEYSFSASIMILAIGVETGIRDIYTLEMMFVLTWMTMILGLLADHISDDIISNGNDAPLNSVFGSWIWLIPHFAAWTTCLAAYGPILDHFITSSSKSDVSAPGFVNVIVFLQFAFFSCFGFVQLYYLIRKSNILQNRGNGNNNWQRYGGNDIQSSVRLMTMYGGNIIDNSNINIDSASNMMSSMNGFDVNSLSSIAETAERMYIVLSLSAKTILSWLILSPILANAVK